MLYKRQYEASSLAAYLSAVAVKVAQGMTKDAAQDSTPQPKVTHLTIKNTGRGREQNLSRRFIRKGLGEGWASISGTALTLKTDGEPLRYLLKRVPGYYCKSSGEAIPVSESAIAYLFDTGQGTYSKPEAQAWLTANGKGADDYEICTAYEVVLDAAQHEQFKLMTTSAGV